MSRKVALLIGVGEFGDGLKPLRCPANGVSAMESVLRSPEIGEFDDVISLTNPDVGEMRSRISSLFAGLTKDDLVLFYFTGHGIKDMNGKFYLSTRQTELFVNGRVNSGTAVEADFLRAVVSDCLALRKVVILDCCFGAAFADGFMGMDDSSVDVEAQLGAQDSDSRGWCVLTASTSTQYALEQEDEELSVYTRYLVAGLKTGGAAPDGKAYISVGNLHAYVSAQIKEAAPAMNPAIFNAQQGADIAIAKAVVDNEQRYRKQVQAKVRRGHIRPAARAYLMQWRQRLELTPEQAAAIEEEILKPARERQKHIEIYVEALKAEKAHAFPLENEAIQDLKDLQRFLNLRDVDVKSIDNNIFVERDRAANAIKAQLETQETVPQSSQKDQTVGLQYPTFSFDTVRVNEQGGIIETIARKAKYFSEDLRKGVTLDMVHIPGGKFLMGTAQEEKLAQAPEYPQHEVTVPEFWMGKHAVTQAQWNAVVTFKKVTRELEAIDDYLYDANYPIARISWNDAMEFCRRLSQHAGREYVLPSEAQWEYACRAKTTTPFSCGLTITSALANYDGIKTYDSEPKGEWRKQMTKVGSFPPNSFGLCDMHGNLAEWCLDGWYDSYNGAPADGSAWQVFHEKRVLRGGSWRFDPMNCRSASRLGAPPDAQDENIGFRVSCVVPKTLQ